MQLLPRRDLQNNKRNTSMRIKAAVSKNLLIFLKKCLTHYVTLKAFRIKPPVKLQKNTPITKEYQKIYCF